MKMVDFIETMKDHWIQYTGDPPDEIVLPLFMYTVLQNEVKERAIYYGDPVQEGCLKKVSDIKISDTSDNHSMIVVFQGWEPVVLAFREINGSSAGRDGSL